MGRFPNNLTKGGSRLQHELMQQNSTKTFQFLLFCWGHDVLAPPSGQENVVADLNESGLQSETDEEGKRSRTERDEEKRGQKEGRKN